MIGTSIITGRIQASEPVSNTVKNLYVKVFTGQFQMKAPRPKKAKVLTGELLLRYSSRQWPEKKNGPMVGNSTVLEGLSLLLKEVNLLNSGDISWSKEQRDIKETVSIRVGPDLAQEILDRGWAVLE